MSISSLSPIRGFILMVALLGFVVINLPFLYFAFFEKAVYDSAMANGVALVFMGEAFFLMLFFAFLIYRLGWQKPGWFLFIVFSLVGSMAFSVPFMLYLQAGKERIE